MDCRVRPCGGGRVIKVGFLRRQGAEQQRGGPANRSYDLMTLANAPQQQRSYDLSIRILNAAERVLQRDGLESFTIAAVASEADVSVGGLYGRFQNRDELVRAVQNEIISRLGRDMSAVLAERFDSLTAMLDRFVTELIAWHGDNRNLLIGKGSEEAADACEGVVTLALIGSARRFEREINHPDPEIALRFVVHVLLASGARNRLSNPAMSQRFIPWPTLSDEMRVFANRYLCAPARLTEET